MRNMKIGSVIERLRSERGWTLDDLEDKSGLTKSSLSRIEKDEQWPRPENLEALAAALDVKIYQIFALAEGEYAPHAPPAMKRDEREIVELYRVMEPDARAQYKKLAGLLAKK